MRSRCASCVSPEQAFVQRKNSTLARIKNPFPRPNQPLYQGQPHILVGVALELDKPATAAVVDGTTGEAIAYRSIKQLLGDNYKLLNHQRQQKRSLSHERHKAQKKAASNQFGVVRKRKQRTWQLLPITPVPTFNYFPNPYLEKGFSEAVKNASIRAV